MSPLEHSNTALGLVTGLVLQGESRTLKLGVSREKWFDLLFRNLMCELLFQEHMEECKAFFELQGGDFATKRIILYYILVVLGQYWTKSQQVILAEK